MDFPVPNNGTLDRMSDDDYKDFFLKYKEHHLEHWPNACMSIPRRKTPQEREKEKEDWTRSKRMMKPMEKFEKQALDELKDDFKKSLEGKSQDERNEAFSKFLQKRSIRVSELLSQHGFI